MTDMTLSFDDAGVLHLQGSIRFENVVQIMEESARLLQEQPVFHIDLEDVEQSDSSGLALLSAWMRLATKQNKDIRFFHVPTNLQELGKVTGLHEILPCA